MNKLTQKELAEMIRNAYKRVEQKKEEINKINVFPVPDQDTGSNLSATLKGAKTVVEGREFYDLKELGTAILEAMLISAQGNAGVIFTGFLAGFLPALKETDVGVKDFSAAFTVGAERARLSIQNPREGTMLDVIDAASYSLKKEAQNDEDFLQILKKAVKEAETALLATREKLPVYKKANVVDAGGMGILIILESWLEILGGSVQPRSAQIQERPLETVSRMIQEITHRYEVVGLIRAVPGPLHDEAEVKEMLKDIGDFIDVIKIGDKMKIHIHTNRPDDAEKAIRGLGEVISMRVEDMAEEVAAKPPILGRSIGIVTEDIADLTPKILEKYRIETAKTFINWPEGQSLSGENLYQKMREAEKRGMKNFPKSSQANPEQYLEAYKKQLKAFEKVLCIAVSSKLSGSFSSALVAKGLVSDPNKVIIFDSLQVSVGQGLVVLRAVELIREGKGVDEITKELSKTIEKIKLYIIFKDPKWVEAGGRISKSQAAWIRRLKMFNIHPLIAVKEGVLAKNGIVFAGSSAEALFKQTAKDSKKDRAAGKKIRAIIAHADDLESAKKLKAMLKEKIDAEISYITLVAPTLGVHAGPGSLIAAWIAIS